MTEPFILRPRPPFSFGRALAFLKRFPPTQGERVIVGASVLGAARVRGQTIGFRVEEAVDEMSPALRCTLTPGQGQTAPVDAATAEIVLRQIRDWLGVDDDLAPFAAARTAKRRLMEQYGGAADVPSEDGADGHTILGFPEPADLARMTQQDLVPLVGSERKADRLLAIARAFLETGEAGESDPAVLRSMPTAELGAWLQALPGIGPWSVSFILLRGFGRVDGPLPLGATQAFDREILQAARAVYGADLTADGLAQIAERYGSQWGTWAHYMRVAG